VNKPIPVILDTDIGGDIDDTWALAMLLKSPELDLKLVVTDTGNTTYRAGVAAKLLIDALSHQDGIAPAPLKAASCTGSDSRPSLCCAASPKPLLLLRTQ
jgi:inosine-uridine nucleoside N-ribohydrolase